eukprot:m.214368 g.214368  ORF g.214368 m.214368 type:complete len:54 (-) comp15866_c0_seq10:169-330(-)
MIAVLTFTSMPCNNGFIVEGPSETCTMHVGQRVGGLVLNRACLSEAVLTPRAV